MPFNVQGYDKFYYAPAGEVVEAEAGVLSVRLKESADYNGFLSFCSANGYSIKKKITRLSAYVLGIPDSDYEKHIEILKASGYVLYAEPDFIVKAFAPPYDEYDSYISTAPDRVWWLNDIHARQAWDTAQGSPDIVVAVLDTGIDWFHPDFSSNTLSWQTSSALWHNTREVSVSSVPFYVSMATASVYFDGQDEDNNGVIDDILGYNFTYDDSKTFYWDTNSPLPYDSHGHGTHVAGIIAARHNNYIGTILSSGMAGIAPKCRIMPVKVLNPSGSSAGVAAGIVYAADMGASIINMSLGGGPPAKIEKDAIDYAYAKGVVIVCAAGNDNSGSLSFPAGFTNVISVGASNKNGYKADFSNYGIGLDVLAPGTSIYSMINSPASFSAKYDSWNGTSMAAPVVSGICVLVRSYYPFLSPNEVKDRITGSTGRSNWTIYEGWGVVNAYRALTAPSAITSQYALKTINYPNPFSLKEAQFTVIKTPENFRGKKYEIKIFNLAGELVRTLTENTMETAADDGIASWDGKNEAGYYVASGLYFYSVNCDGKTANGKITFIK